MGTIINCDYNGLIDPKKDGSISPWEKALELLSKYSDHVNPYVGSGMLTNDINWDQIFKLSKVCVEIFLEEIISLEYYSNILFDDNGDPFVNTDTLYWLQVKEELNKITKSEFLSDDKVCIDL